MKTSQKVLVIWKTLFKNKKESLSINICINGVEFDICDVYKFLADIIIRNKKVGANSSSSELAQCLCKEKILGEGFQETVDTRLFWKFICREIQEGYFKC
jgi:hypothetical protein